jgi:cobaltochelatase CobS
MNTTILSAANRKLLRSAITKAPGWKAYRQANNIDVSVLTTNELLAAAAFLNVPVPGAEPMPSKPRPHRPSDVQRLSKRLFDVGPRIAERDLRFAQSVLETIRVKQDGWATEAQFAHLYKIVEAGEKAPRVQEKEAPAPKAPKVIEAPKAPVAPTDETDLVAALRRAVGATQIDEAAVRAIVEEALANRPVSTDQVVTHRIEVVTSTGVRVVEGTNHYLTGLLLAAVGASVNVMLVGPAGSGKTTAAERVAEALGLPFYMTGAVDTSYKLSGFMDAQGRFVETQFYKAFKDGGVFLFDELDGSAAGAVLWFNAALANGFADFPCGMVPRHPDFRVIAAANTFGRGANRQYVGRAQLDAASLDRFVTINWDYDTGLEAAMVGVSAPVDAPKAPPITPRDGADLDRSTLDWLRRVQRVRRAVEEQGIRHVVSPRATIFGRSLLAAGWPLDLVEAGVLWKGLDADTVSKIDH